MSYKQVHIVGCSPRSGTTLLHEMMATCFVFDRQYDTERRFNRTTAGAGQTLLSKRPKDTQFMPLLLRYVPDFWVVYVLRDPRDVVVSRHANAVGHYYSNLRLWREQHNHAQKMRLSPRFVQVRYEDLVSQPDVVQSQLQQAIPWLEQRHTFSQYHEYASVSTQSEKAMHGVRPVTVNSVGRWKQNVARIVGQTKIHGSFTADLVNNGYERDDKWEQSLVNIQPDFTPSYYPETLNYWHKFRASPNIFMKVAGYRLQRKYREYRL